MTKTSEVDGDNVPCRHFGVVLSMKQRHELADRLQVARTEFIIEPHIRFKGDPGEQATMFFLDPSGNAVINGIGFPSTANRNEVPVTRDYLVTQSGLPLVR